MALRALPLLAVAAAVALSVAPGTGPTTAPAPAPAPKTASVAFTTDTAHPYSNPVWYPIHAKVYLDCVRSNPGCAGTHSDWTMDLVRETLPGNNPAGDLGVYAMGAGRLFVGNSHGAPCVEGAPANFGTWVWIDHGGGVVSRYGHLSSIGVGNGGYVAAGQRIGTMGTTGKGSNCAVPYVDFQVRHRGPSGPRVEIKTLKACVDGGVANWPTDLDATVHWRQVAPAFPQPSTPTRYAVWNDVPQRSVDFPATTGSCIPATVPRTPEQPTGVGVSRAGSGRLNVHWSSVSVPAATTVQVRLSEYHPSTRSWDYVQNEQFVAASPGTTSHLFSGLLDGRPYRARVSFGNSAGWSVASPWVVRAPAARPDAPRLRDLYVSGVRTSTVHFKWYGSRTHGVPVTAYQAQLRRVLPDGYTAWKTARTVDAYYTWFGLRRKATYQVRVRALSSLGASGYLRRTTGT